MPTFHPNCRCGIRQVLPDAVKGSLRRAARDSGGNTVSIPATMTYDQWDSRFGTPTKRSKLDLPESTSSVVTKAVRKPEALSLDNYPRAFTATKKEKKNTEILIQRINSAEGADPDVVKMYGMLAQTENFESNGVEFRITHTKSHMVSYSQGFDGTLKEAKLVVPDLTKDSGTGAVATTLHEQMHLLDFIGRTNPKKVGGWLSEKDAYTKAIDDAGPEMGAEVSLLFAQRRESYRAKERELREGYKAELTSLTEKYKAGEIGYKEYSKEYKAAGKRMYDALDLFARNDMGGGIDCLEDIYDALSRGSARGETVLYGHGKKYYRGRWSREREILANYGALSVLRPDLVEVLRRDKPGLVRELEALVREFIDRTW